MMLVGANQFILAKGNIVFPLLDKPRRYQQYIAGKKFVADVLAILEANISDKVYMDYLCSRNKGEGCSFRWYISLLVHSSAILG